MSLCNLFSITLSSCILLCSLLNKPSKFQGLVFSQTWGKGSGGSAHRERHNLLQWMSHLRAGNVPTPFCQLHTSLLRCKGPWLPERRGEVSRSVWQGSCLLRTSPLPATTCLGKTRGLNKIWDSIGNELSSYYLAIWSSVRTCTSAILPRTSILNSVKDQNNTHGYQIQLKSFWNLRTLYLKQASFESAKKTQGWKNS